MALNSHITLKGNLTSAGTGVLNTVSPTALQYNVSNVAVGTALSYDGANPTRLVIEEAGDYLLIFNITVQNPASDSNRHRIATYAQVNGTTIVPGAESGTSYMRNSGGSDSSSNKFVAPIIGAQIGDYVEVFTQDTESTSQDVTPAHDFVLQAIPLATDAFVATTVATTAGTDFNNTGDTVLWETPLRDDTPYSVSSGTITISEAGVYHVAFNLPLDSPNTRVSPQVSIYIDGVEIPETRARNSYLRDSGHVSSVHLSTHVEVTAGQTLELRTDIKGGAGTSTVATDFSGKGIITIQKDEESIVYIGSGATTSAGTEYNLGTAGTVYLTTDERIDSEYTRPTSEGVLVSGGDYLVAFNAAVASLAQRPAPRFTLLVDGSPIDVSAGESYIRRNSGHDQSSVSFTALLPALAPASVISVEVQEYASSGTVTADTGHRLSVTQLSAPSGATASFTVATNVLEATFTDTSTDDGTNAITGWDWNFGDGNTSTAQNPVHTYAESGVYVVTLSTTDAIAGTAVAFQNLHVTDDSYQDLIDADGAIARYSFTEDLTDSVGTREGTAGAGTVTYGAGHERTGWAGEFDQASDVVVPSTFGIFDGLQDFTIESWFNAASFNPDENNFFDSRVIFSARGEASLLITDSDGASSPNRMTVKVDQGGWQTLMETPVLNLSQWYHLVVTFEAANGQWYMYLDGVLVDQAINTAAIVGDNKNNAIGNSDSGASRYFHGLIDEVAIYDRPLSLGEAYAHHVAGTDDAPTTNNVVANRTQALLRTNTVDFNPFDPAEGDRLVQSDKTFALGRTSTVEFIAEPAYSAAILADNPVAYWKFDNNYADTAGANDATNLGTTFDTGAPGIPGQSASFNLAQADRISIPNTFGIFGGDVDFSVEAWFNVATWNTANNWQDSRILFSPQGENEMMITDGDGASTANRITVRTQLSGSWQNPVESPVLNADQWYHFVLTYEVATGMYRMYLDGSEVDFGTGSSTSVNTTSSGSYIGGGHDGNANRTWDGQIDELAIYDTLLTPVKISGHYAAATTAPAEYSASAPRSLPSVGRASTATHAEPASVHNAAADRTLPSLTRSNTGTNEPPATPASTPASAAVVPPDVDVTGFTALVDLASLPQAWWDQVNTTDGTRGRAYDQDGNELACDWIDFDSAAETGLVRVGWIGTLSAKGGDAISLYPPQTSNTPYAVGDPYGQHAAYDANWKGYWPLHDADDATVGGVKDRTQYQNHGTADQAFALVDGPAGKAAYIDQGTTGNQLNGTGVGIIVPDADSLDCADAVTVGGWANHVNQTGKNWGRIVHKSNGSTGDTWSLYAEGGGDPLVPGMRVNGSGITTDMSAKALWDQRWGQMVGRWGKDFTPSGGSQGDATIFANYDEDGTTNGARTTAQGTNTNEVGIGRHADGEDRWINGYLAHVFVHDVAREDEWVRLEYRQVRDNSNAYGDWSMGTEPDLIETAVEYFDFRGQNALASTNPTTIEWNLSNIEVRNGFEDVTVGTPDGWPSYSLLPSTATGEHNIYDQVLNGLSATHVWVSFVAKADGYDSTYVRIGSGPDHIVSLADGSVLATDPSFDRHEAISLGGGWWRIRVRSTRGVGDNVSFGVADGSTVSFTGDGLAGIRIGELQIEVDRRSGLYVGRRGTERLGRFNDSIQLGSTTAADANDPTESMAGLVFDGVDDYAEADSELCVTGALPRTYIVAYRCHTQSAKQTILAMGAKSTDNLVRLDQDFGRLNLATWSASDIDTSAGTDIAVGQTVIAAVRYDGTTVYLDDLTNGEQASQVVALNTTSSQVYLGGGPLEQQPFDGDIQFFATFDRFLDDAELATASVGVKAKLAAREILPSTFDHWFTQGENRFRCSANLDAQGTWKNIATNSNTIASETTPDGNLAFHMVPGTSSNEHGVYANADVSGKQAWMTALVKPNGYTDAIIRVQTGGGWGDHNNTYFDLTGAGSVAQTGTDHSLPFIEQLTDGWYRIGVFLDATATNSLVGIDVADGLTHSFAGDGTSGLLVGEISVEHRATRIGKYLPTMDYRLAALQFADVSNNLTIGSTAGSDTNEPVFTADDWQFDGVDDQVGTGALLSFDAQDFTAFVWVDGPPTVADQWGRHIAYGPNTGGFNISVDDTTLGEARFEIQTTVIGNVTVDGPTMLVVRRSDTVGTITNVRTGETVRGTIPTNTLGSRDFSVGSEGAIFHTNITTRGAGLIDYALSDYELDALLEEFETATEYVPPVDNSRSVTSTRTLPSLSRTSTATHEFSTPAFTDDLTGGGKNLTLQGDAARADVQIGTRQVPTVQFAGSGQAYVTGIADAAMIVAWVRLTAATGWTHAMSTQRRSDGAGSDNLLYWNGYSSQNARDVMYVDDELTAGIQTDTAGDGWHLYSIETDGHTDYDLTLGSKWSDVEGMTGEIAGVLTFARLLTESERLWVWNGGTPRTKSEIEAAITASTIPQPNEYYLAAADTVLETSVEWWDLRDGSGQEILGQVAGTSLQLGSTTGADTNDPTHSADGLVFDGVDDYAELATDIEFDGDFTVYARLWLNPDDIDEQDVVFAAPDIGGVYQRNNINFFDGKPRLYSPDTAGPNDKITAVTSAPGGAWFYVAVSRQDTTMKIYVDSATPDATSTDGGFGKFWIRYIGAFVGADYLKGTIGQTVFLDYALTDQEVADLDAEIDALLANDDRTVTSARTLPSLSRTSTATFSESMDFYFSADDYTVGNTEVDLPWTHYGETAATIEIKNDATDGQYLEFRKPGSGFDAVYFDDAGQLLDSEVYCLFKMADPSEGLNASVVAIKGELDSDPKSLGFQGYQSGPTQWRVQDDHSNTQPATLTTPTSLHSTLYAARIRCEGTSYKARVWLASDPEPATWGVDTTIQQWVADLSGGVGAFFWSGNQGIDIYEFGVDAIVDPDRTVTSARTLPALSRTSTATQATAFQSDDFSTGSLNTSLWTIVDPVGDGTVTSTGTTLEMAIPGGTEHDVWDAGNNGLWLTQSMSDTDFEIEIKFESFPYTQYQSQGLLFGESPGNLVRFDFFGHNNYKIFAAKATGGSFSAEVNISLPAAPTTDLRMRINRTGDLWTQTFSIDGGAWTQASQFTHALTITKGGPFVGNASGGSSPAFTGVVDYVFNTASPIVPEDGANDDRSVAGARTLPVLSRASTVTHSIVGLARSVSSGTTLPALSRSSAATLETQDRSGLADRTLPSLSRTSTTTHDISALARSVASDRALPSLGRSNTTTHDTSVLNRSVSADTTLPAVGRSSTATHDTGQLARTVSGGRALPALGRSSTLALEVVSSDAASDRTLPALTRTSTATHALQDIGAASSRTLPALSRSSAATHDTSGLDRSVVSDRTLPSVSRTSTSTHDTSTLARSAASNRALPALGRSTTATHDTSTLTRSVNSARTLPGVSRTSTATHDTSSLARSAAGSTTLPALDRSSTAALDVLSISASSDRTLPALSRSSTATYTAQDRSVSADRALPSVSRTSDATHDTAVLDRSVTADTTLPSVSRNTSATHEKPNRSASTSRTLPGVSRNTAATFTTDLLDRTTSSSRTLPGLSRTNTTTSDIPRPTGGTVYDFEFEYPFDLGEPSAFIRSLDSAKEGSYGIESTVSADYVVATSSAEYHEMGPDFHLGAWVRCDTGAGHEFKAPGLAFAHPGDASDNGYQAVFDARDGTLALRTDFDHSNPTTVPIAGFAMDTWYWLEVTWDNSVITGTVYDVPGGTVLASGTRNDAKYTAGYVGVAAYSAGSIDSLTIGGAEDADGYWTVTSPRSIPSLQRSSTATHAAQDNVVVSARSLPSLSRNNTTTHSVDSLARSVDSSRSLPALERSSTLAVEVEAYQITAPRALPVLGRSSTALSGYLAASSRSIPISRTSTATHERPDRAASSTRTLSAPSRTSSATHSTAGLDRSVVGGRALPALGRASTVALELLEFSASADRALPALTRSSTALSGYLASSSRALPAITRVSAAIHETPDRSATSSRTLGLGRSSTATQSTESLNRSAGSSRTLPGPIKNATATHSIQSLERNVATGRTLPGPDRTSTSTHEIPGQSTSSSRTLPSLGRTGTATHLAPQTSVSSDRTLPSLGRSSATTHSTDHLDRSTQSNRSLPSLGRTASVIYTPPGSITIQANTVLPSLGRASTATFEPPVFARYIYNGTNFVSDNRKMRVDGIWVNYNQARKQKRQGGGWS